jgi:hypothetical protein
MQLTIQQNFIYIQFSSNQLFTLSIIESKFLIKITKIISIVFVVVVVKS